MSVALAVVVFLSRRNMTDDEMDFGTPSGMTLMVFSILSPAKSPTAVMVNVIKPTDLARKAN